jgi:hypothetical protein
MEKQSVGQADKQAHNQLPVRAVVHQLPPLTEIATFPRVWQMYTVGFGGYAALRPIAKDKTSMKPYRTTSTLRSQLCKFMKLVKLIQNHAINMRAEGKTVDEESAALENEKN